MLSFIDNKTPGGLNGFAATLPLQLRFLALAAEPSVVVLDHNVCVVTGGCADRLGLSRLSCALPSQLQLERRSPGQHFKPGPGLYVREWRFNGPEPSGENAA